MAQLNKPPNVLVSPNELKVGDVVYKVTGIYPPFASKIGNLVLSTPIKYSKHEEFKGYQGDSLVFDIAYLDKEGNPEHLPNGELITEHKFCGDCNLENYSHNDNYLCRTYEDAVAAAEWLLEQYKAKPDFMFHEIERRERILESYEDWFDEVDSWDHA